MIPLDIVVVVGSWDVRWIQVNEIDIRNLVISDIQVARCVALAVVEHGRIKDLHLFQKMLFNRNAKVAATIIVTIAANSKDSTGLFLYGESDERRESEGALIWIFEALHICTDAIQKNQVVGSVKNVFECLLDKGRSIPPFGQKSLQCRAVDNRSGVFDRGLGKYRRKSEEIGGVDPFAHAFQQVCDASTA
jgi:hypothetical protein